MANDGRVTVGKEASIGNVRVDGGNGNGGSGRIYWRHPRQYFTMPPHSIWNPCGIHEMTWIPYGFHMEYVSSLNHIFTNMDSTWIPHGFHGLIPYGFHMYSTWNRFHH
jgi:hypothetical protein